MKKILACMLAAVLFCLCACNAAPPAVNSDQIKIVATIFPEYDWVKAILGERLDRAELTLLLDSGADLHNYQPTAEDILKISNCGLFVYVGGESDEWVEDVLRQTEGVRTLNLLEALGDAAKAEETVEGMEQEHEEEVSDAEEAEYDEHVWLSVRNAAVLCEAICDALCELDPDGAETYKQNLAEYQAQLAALDAQYQAAADGGSVKTLLFADRFPFRYLVDDYGLSYYAAFSGCSAETEASFETVAFLAEKLRALSLPAVLTIEGADRRIAETVLQTAGLDVPILSLDSMQSPEPDSVSYLSIMENNLAVLKDAVK